MKRKALGGKKCKRRGEQLGRGVHGGSKMNEKVPFHPAVLNYTSPVRG